MTARRFTYTPRRIPFSASDVTGEVPLLISLFIIVIWISSKQFLISKPTFNYGRSSYTRGKISQETDETRESCFHEFQNNLFTYYHQFMIELIPNFFVGSAEEWESL